MRPCTRKSPPFFKCDVASDKTWLKVEGHVPIAVWPASARGGHGRNYPGHRVRRGPERRRDALTSGRMDMGFQYEQVGMV